MKNIITSAIVLAVIIAFTFPTEVNAQPKPVSDKYSYVGTKTCGMCHKEQLKVWESTAHSKAMETLKTAEADKIAKDLGHGDKAIDADACIKCHTPQFNVDKALLGKKFKLDDGVQCESCHGAGDEYKNMKVMKDHAASVENGMRDFTNEEAIKDFCVQCHNDESPTHKEFKFEEMWAKIKHPVEKK